MSIFQNNQHLTTVHYLITVRIQLLILIDVFGTVL